MSIWRLRHLLCTAARATPRPQAQALALVSVSVLGLLAGPPPGAGASASLSATGTTRAGQAQTVPGSGATVRPAGARAPDTVKRTPERRIALSNERTLTVWAHPAHVASIFKRPGGRGGRVGWLHLYTSDGFPEVYVLLAERIEARGRAWVRVRVPARPNGQTGWVRRGALGRFHVTHWLLVVNRRAERLTAYWNGRRRFSAPVGVGAPATPTPAGRFWIREKFPIADRASGYWPDAFGTADYSTLSEWPGGGVVGIHGPYGEPGAIPGDPSHGCIRMHTGDVAWLYRHIPVGAALRVL